MFELTNVDVDSSIAGVESVLESDLPHLVSILGSCHLDSWALGWSGSLDEADIVVEGEEDVVLVVPHLSNGAELVEINFDSQVEAIFAGPSVGTCDLWCDHSAEAGLVDCVTGVHSDESIGSGEKGGEKLHNFIFLKYLNKLIINNMHKWKDKYNT
mgnify:CR=1 FL=1